MTTDELIEEFSTTLLEAIRNSKRECVEDLRLVIEDEELASNMVATVQYCSLAIWGSLIWDIWKEDLPLQFISRLESQTRDHKSLKTILDKLSKV